MKMFKIVFPMELIPYKYYTGLDVIQEELTNLSYAQLDFSARFEDSPWYILLGEQEYYFEVNDLGYIWEELPELLRQCIDAQTPIINFYFAAQGTDTALLVEPSSANRLLCSIIRSFVDRRLKGAPFDELGLQRIDLSMSQFLTEWLTLVDTMIQLLIEHNLISSEDPSIQDYLALLPTL